MVDYASMVGQTVADLLVILKFAMYTFFIGGGIIALFLFRIRYVNKIRIRHLTGTKDIVQDDYFSISNKNGNIEWRRLFGKEQIPIAPEDCISITSKGKKIVEAYRTSTGEFIYIRSDATLARPPKEIMDIQNEQEKIKALKDWQKRTGSIAPFEPVTTNQRIMFRDIYKRINAKRNETLKANIPQLAAFGSMALIIIALFIFWGDIAQPSLDMANKAIEYQRVQVEYLELLKEIKNDVGELKQQQGLTPSAAPPI